MNWLEIANRNAEEHDANVQNFIKTFGWHPDAVRPLFDLIQQQSNSFFIFYGKYLESGTSSTLR